MIQEERQHLVDHDRLLAAADRLLVAFNSPAGCKTCVPVYAGTNRLSGTLPQGIFTLDEYCEAMAMLMRLGVVPKDASPLSTTAHAAPHARTTP